MRTLATRAATKFFSISTNLDNAIHARAQPAEENVGTGCSAPYLGVKRGSDGGKGAYKSNRRPRLDHEPP